MRGVKLGQHRAKKTKAGTTLPCGRTIKGPPKKPLPVPPAPKTLAPSPTLYDVTITVKCSGEYVEGAKVNLNRARVMRTKADGKVTFRKREKGQYRVEVQFDKGSPYANSTRDIVINVRTEIKRTIAVDKKPNAIVVRAKRPKSTVLLKDIRVEIGPQKSITTNDSGLANSSFMDPGIYTVTVHVPKPQESIVEVFYRGKLKGNFEAGADVSFPIRLERGDVDKELRVHVTPYQWVELEFVDSKDTSKPIKGLGACVIFPDGTKKVKNSRSNGVAKIEYSQEGNLQIERVIVDGNNDFPQYMMEAELEK
jgi:hypothetical protein